MSWIGGLIFIKDNKLLVFTALNNLRRSSIEFGLDLIDDRQYERSKKAKDENIQLFCSQSVQGIHIHLMLKFILALQLLYQRWKDGNVFDRLRY